MLERERARSFRPPLRTRNLTRRASATAAPPRPVDCLWPHLYEGTPQQYFDEDVLAMTSAFSAAGLELSLSPGISVSPQNGSWLAAGRRAGFYRIAEDVLDVYDGQPDGTFPQGLHQKLTKAVGSRAAQKGARTWALR